MSVTTLSDFCFFFFINALTLIKFFMMMTSFNTIFLAFPGITEMLPILLIALLIFGGKKIPELMKGLGSGIREFNDAKNNVKKEIQESATEKETK
jgi:sec-independent protein translocase protein TatA